MPIHDPNGFEHRLWEAVTGGRPRWPDRKRSAFLLTYDMDADSSWISRGLDEPIARSGGQFEVNVGTPCILELMKWFGLKTTFFTPGWIAEQYPGNGRGGVPRRTRDRLSRLPARAADEPKGSRRNRDRAPRLRGHREADRQAPDRVPLADLAVQPEHGSHPARRGLPLHQRLHAHAAADLQRGRRQPPSTWSTCREAGCSTTRCISSSTSVRASRCARPPTCWRSTRRSSARSMRPAACSCW